MGDVRLPSRVEHTYTLVARTPHTSNGTRRDHWFLRAHARHVSGLSGTHRTLPPQPFSRGALQGFIAGKPR